MRNVLHRHMRQCIIWPLGSLQSAVDRAEAPVTNMCSNGQYEELGDEV